jgi:hypothetical protein
MKKTAIYISMVTLIILNVLGTQTLVARNSSTSAFKSNEMKKLNAIIAEAVKYPDFTLSKEERGEVTVTFSLTDEGKVKVENVIASSRRIEDYVKEQLTDVIAKDVLHFYNQQFCVKFRFENC